MPFLGAFYSCLIEIKSCGLSQNKLLAILEIASQSASKKLPTSNEIIKMSDNEIIKLFTTIKGIGEWTVQMLLIFNLGRLDIIPKNDLAIRKNYRKLKSIEKLRKPKRNIFAICIPSSKYHLKAYSTAQ